VSYRDNGRRQPANRNARSKQWQPWLAACQRKRLRFLRFSFTQRTQRRRLRLNGNRALAYILFVQRTTFSTMRMTLIWQCPLRIRVPVKMKSYTSNNGSTATTCDWTIQSRRRSFSALEVFKASQCNLHLRVWTSSASPAIQCSASSSTTKLLTAVDHVNSLLSSSARLLYPLRILRSHGIPIATPTLHDVFRATIVAKIRLHTARPAWSGFCSAADRLRLDSFHFYPDVNVLVLLTILSPQLNCYLVMPTITYSLASKRTAAVTMLCSHFMNL